MTVKFQMNWPPGWARTPAARRQADRFQCFTPTAADRIKVELAILGIKESQVVIHIAPLGTGDPGAAVHWTDREGRPNCMATDRYQRVEANLAGIAASLKAMRDIRRHGGQQVSDKAMSGFAALPAPAPHWKVLELATDKPTVAEVEEAFRKLAMRHHPDRGGNPDAMAKINAARAALLQQV